MIVGVLKRLSARSAFHLGVFATLVVSVGCSAHAGTIVWHFPPGTTKQDYLKAKYECDRDYEMLEKFDPRKHGPFKSYYVDKRRAEMWVECMVSKRYVPEVKEE